MRPVSRVRVLPPHSSDTVFVSNIGFPYESAGPDCAAGPQVPGVPSRSGAGRFWPQRLGPPKCETCPECEKRPTQGPLPVKLLLTQTQLLDQTVVALDVLLLEVREQAAALVDHHQQAAARMVILVVALEVLGQVADALGEDRDLDFGGTGVALGLGVAGNDFLLLLGGNRHAFTPRYR